MLSLLAFAALAPLNVHAFGATGDGQTLDTESIQRCLFAASNRVIDFPAGVYLTGSLRLPSNTEIHLEKGAVIKGSPFRHDYQHGTWFALFIAKNVHHVTITGPGTIDGNGGPLSEDTKRLVHIGKLTIPPGRWRPSETDRPEVIEMTNCQDVMLREITIKGGAGWTEVYRNCQNLTLDHVKVRANAYWNNDGVDLVDCQRAKVTRCDIDCDDDGVCLKSDDPKSGCDHILITHCRIRSGASAIKFGTASHGGFRHVTIRDIHIHDTFRSALALESVDGATLEDIDADGVHAVNTGNAFFIRLGHRNLSAPPGKVRRISLSNFDVQVPLDRPDKGYPFPCPPYPEKFNVCPSSIVGMPEATVAQVSLKNITIRMPGGADPHYAFRAPLKVPERKSVYPEFSMFGELPAWGLYVRHAKQIQVQNVRLVLAKPDYRVPIILDDVKGLTATALSVKGAKPVAKVHKSQASFSKLRLIRLP